MNQASHSFSHDFMFNILNNDDDEALNLSEIYRSILLKPSIFSNRAPRRIIMRSPFLSEHKLGRIRENFKLDSGFSDSSTPSFVSASSRSASKRLRVHTSFLASTSASLAPSIFIVKHMDSAYQDQDTERTPSAKSPYQFIGDLASQVNLSRQSSLQYVYPCTVAIVTSLDSRFCYLGLWRKFQWYPLLLLPSLTSQSYVRHSTVPFLCPYEGKHHKHYGFQIIPSILGRFCRLLGVSPRRNILTDLAPPSICGLCA